MTQQSIDTMMGKMSALFAIHRMIKYLTNLTVKAPSLKRSKTLVG